MNSGYETLDAHAKLKGAIPGIYLTIKTLLNRKVIKAQLNNLSIEDETDIFIFLAIEQTWITTILLNLEQRHFIPRLGGFSENTVSQFYSNQFLRHFKVSPKVLI